MVQDIHAISQMDQFLMKLRLKFENVRSNLMSQVPSHSIETSLSELLREEQCLATQAALVHTALGVL